MSSTGLSGTVGNGAGRPLPAGPLDHSVRSRSLRTDAATCIRTGLERARLHCGEGGVQLALEIARQQRGLVVEVGHPDSVVRRAELVVTGDRRSGGDSLDRLADRHLEVFLGTGDDALVRIRVRQELIDVDPNGVDALRASRVE